MRRAALLVVCALAATLGLSGPLPAAAAPSSSPYTGWVDGAGEPCGAAEALRWLDEGVAAASKFFYDPSTDAWYWAEADGSIARDHDAYVPLSNGVDQELWLTDDAYRRANGKWVRLGADGAMVKGESLSNGGWYYFDPITGAMDFEWAYLPHANKWVYYDPVTGRMWYGQHMVDGRPYYFDAVTGRKLEPAELRQRLVSTAVSTYYTHPDCDAALREAGGTTCTYGPCMAYVWWVFHQADLDIFLSDGQLLSGWPHDQFDWYKARGRVDRTPRPGDVVFFRFDGFATNLGLSASHAGIVVGTSGSYVLVADAAYDSIEQRAWRMDSYMAGVAHPYWGD